MISYFLCLNGVLPIHFVKPSVGPLNTLGEPILCHTPQEQRRPGVAEKEM